MSVKQKNATAADGHQVAYNVLACDAPNCVNEANPDVQHQANWLTVFEYWVNVDGAYGQFERNFCSRAHMAQMPAMPAPPKMK